MSHKFYHARTPHLVSESVVLTLLHLYCHFLASGAINLVDHWNDYEDHEGMIISKPLSGRQVYRLCSFSVVYLHLRCDLAQHRPLAISTGQAFKEKILTVSGTSAEKVMGANGFDCPAIFWARSAQLFGS